MKVLLIFYLSFTAGRLDDRDICQFLKSSDRSFRIGLYRRLSGDMTNSADTYYLFRRDEQSSTRMWEISFDRVSGEEFKVKLNGESVESIGENTTHAFSLEASDDRKVWNCSVVKEWSVDVRQTQATTYCESSSKKIGSKVYFIGDLIFRGKPSDSLAVNVVDKYRKGFKPLEYKTLEVRKNEIQFGSKGLCDSDKCTEFLAINAKASPLSDRLEAIMDFKVGDRSGHLFLFNIKGEPKYCIQELQSFGSTLNRRKCISDTDLLPLADQCYQSSASDIGTEGWSPMTMILIFFGVFLAMILVPIVCIGICFCCGFSIVAFMHNAKHPTRAVQPVQQTSGSLYPRQGVPQPTDQWTATPTVGPSQEIGTPVQPNSAPLVLVPDLSQ